MFPTLKNEEKKRRKEKKETDDPNFLGRADDVYRKKQKCGRQIRRHDKKRIQDRRA